MKKDRSRRYKTACLEAVFDSFVPNTMHIDDFIMYSGEVGTDEENQLQNSYFQMDIAKMKLLNTLEEKKEKNMAKEIPNDSLDSEVHSDDLKEEKKKIQRAFFAGAASVTRKSKGVK